MAQGPLVDLHLQDGRALLERLAAEGVPMTGACWLREAESEQWYLFLATPLVSRGSSTREAYGQVSATLRRFEEPLWVRLMDIKVVAADGPVGKALQELYARYPGAKPIRFDGDRFGDVPISGAFVYPPTVAAAR